MGVFSAPKSPRAFPPSKMDRPRGRTLIVTNDGKLTRHNLKKVQCGPVMWTTVHHKTSDQTDHVSGQHCETAISRQGVNEWMDAHRIALPLSNVCKAAGWAFHKSCG